MAFEKKTFFESINSHKNKSSHLERAAEFYAIELTTDSVDVIDQET